MIWPFVGGRDQAEPRFVSHTSLAVERAVVLLGAGVSAGAGVPVMRGFIDRARDYVTQGSFSEHEAVDVRRTLDFYEQLRHGFSITEEDIENVETLLSLADLCALVGNVPFGSIEIDGLGDSVRRFIERVVTRSSCAASPESPVWVSANQSGPLGLYKSLARAMAYCGDRLTVITLNYDCLLEYACFCLGIPFTYHRGFGDGGVEILKLHGSINWVRCPDRSCPWRDHTWISPLEYVADRDGDRVGHVRPRKQECPGCGLELVPIIVPPTWTKDIEDEFIRASWKRSIAVLNDTQALVAAGISLPVSDAHIRHLLHLGLAPGRLIQALVVVGSDPGAADRWSRLFRESWREARLEVRQTSFSRAMYPAILPGLTVPEAVLHGPSGHMPLLPIPLGVSPFESQAAKLEAVLQADGHTEEEAAKLVGSVDWGGVLEKMRAGEEARHESISVYRDALARAGFDWIPAGEILPTHGDSLDLSEPVTINRW